MKDEGGSGGSGGSHFLSKRSRYCISHASPSAPSCSRRPGPTACAEQSKTTPSSCVGAATRAARCAADGLQPSDVDGDGGNGPNGMGRA